MKTAYAYARFSSDNQREESITAQLRAIHEYCDTHDIHILQEFKDEAVSARTDKRPQFQEMFATIKERPADYLIVHKLDRFARNRADAAFYRGKLKETGMRLVSVLEPLDDSPESIIMEGLLDSLNEYYSANLSRESKKGIKENIIQGKRNGGKAPWGYTCVNQHLVPNKDAETVKRFFQMYAEGKKLSVIAERLKLPITNYQAVLGNEVYIGNLRSGQWVHENAHEPIVDMATWELVQKRRHDSQFNASNRKKEFYLLSGMLVCGKCGKRMICYQAKGKYFYYSCKTKDCETYRRDELDKRVIHQLALGLRATDVFKARFYEIVSNRVNSKARDKEAEIARSTLSKRISKLIDSVQYAETDEDVKRIMGKVNELRKQMPKERPKVEVSRAACDAFIEEFCDIENREPEVQRLILKKCIDKIVVKPDDIILFTNIQKGTNIIINKHGEIKKAPEGACVTISF